MPQMRNYLRYYNNFIYLIFKKNMSYKVLNPVWEIIIVDMVDPIIHRHLSWRQFNEKDNLVFANNKDRKKFEKEYKKLYWQKPSSLYTTESIIKLINDKKTKIEEEKEK